MRKPIPYGRQYIDEEDIRSIIDALQSDFLTQGPKVVEFEENFAQYTDSKYAVAVSNGTAALHLAGLALGIKPGHKVITTPITFAATANSMIYSGAVVDFVDIDPTTFLIDLNKVAERLARSPAGTYTGILPVDFAGLPANTELLRELADEYGLWIIEDACHAPGGYFVDSNQRQIRCGSGVYSDLTVFSFHPVKHIASGEGGMITTNDENFYQKLLLLRSHGIIKSTGLMIENHGGWYHEMHELGFNYRLPDINCALGISQLTKADAGMKRRHIIAERYTAAFDPIPEIKMQRNPEGFFNAYHLFVIRVPERKSFYNYLRENHIYAQIHYLPCHLHPYYQRLGWKKGDFPVAEAYYDECISLPMFPTLTDDEQDYVINKTLSFFGQ